MSTPTKPPRPSSTRDSRAFGKLHRLTGLTVALPVIVLVLTGIPLQFTQQLELGSKPVDVAWVHAQYNIDAPRETYSSNGVTQLGDLLFANNRVIQIDENLIGALTREVATVVVLDNTVLLIPMDIDVPVESLQLPQRATALGEHSNANLLLDTPAGMLASDDLGATWSSISIDDYQSVETTKANADADTKQLYRSHKISWERLLQDMHSGRLFGAIGEWIMNLAGLALIVLALTGVYVWARGRPKVQVDTK